jgi:cell division protein FtsQ
VSTARVRRGSTGRSRKTAPRVAVPRKLASKLPVKQESANRVARWACGLFVAAIAVVIVIAMDLPAKAWTGFGSAMGDAGFRVQRVDVTGVKNMDSKPVYDIAFNQQSTAMPLVDVSGIRESLLKYGWVKDARVARRLPDTLVIDIVERDSAAIWQDRNKLSLVDADGVVLGPVKVTEMPDLPLLIGTGANAQSRYLERVLADAPALRPQLESATWVSQRRWDLAFQSGEVIALPEGEGPAKSALAKFAKLDKSAGLLGRGIVRIDLRIPGKMIVRLPQTPVASEQPLEQEG